MTHIDGYVHICTQMTTTKSCLSHISQNILSPKNPHNNIEKNIQTEHIN